MSELCQITYGLMLLLSRTVTTPGHSPVVSDDMKNDLHLFRRTYQSDRYKKQRETDKMDFKMNKERCLLFWELALYTRVWTVLMV